MRERERRDLKVWVRRSAAAVLYYVKRLASLRHNPECELSSYNAADLSSVVPNAWRL